MKEMVKQVLAGAFLAALAILWYRLAGIECALALLAGWIGANGIVVHRRIDELKSCR